MSDELMVKCDLCGEIIAKTTEDALACPMTGAMFSSPDSDHGIPDPFDKNLSWEDFRCPYGRTHRPFISRYRISTILGQYRAAKNGIEGGFIENRPEIDRESIIDGPCVPTDEQAEAIVRAEVEAKPIENKESVPRKTDVITCDVCGKSVQRRGYSMHRRSHKEIINA